VIRLLVAHAAKVNVVDADVKASIDLPMRR
jgi:hypothetical protein